jgi:hypothetical protein
VVGHIEVDDTSPSVRENHEAIKQAESRRGYDEEITGSGAVHVVLEE